MQEKRNYLDLPPVWLLFFMGLVYLQSRIWNPLSYGSGFSTAFGWVLIAAGLALTLWAALHFRAHKTSIVPGNIPRSIITGGPYKFSRNPIYLADALMLLGVVLLFDSMLGAILVPAFVMVINKRFIEGEEAGLRAAFPDEADGFFGATRRWL